MIPTVRRSSPARRGQRLLSSLALLLGGALAESHGAETWNGAFAIVPLGAPAMALAPATAPAAEGTVVTITALGEAQALWTITPRADGSVTIAPPGSPTLRLAVEGAGTANGTRILLERDQGKPSQAWTITGNA